MVHVTLDPPEGDGDRRVYADVQRQWLSDYYGQLEGATITKAVIVAEYGELWPILEVTLASGEATSLIVSQDQEGNAPGWLGGLPIQIGESQ